MKSQFIRNALLLGPGVCAAVAIAATTVPSGPNKIAFPTGWEKAVLYGSVDRYDIKQHREFYASAENVNAVREGKPIPYGTVLTMAVYKSKVDATGNPIKDGSGRFAKDDLTGIFVMEKRQGFGADVPAELRNGEWEYQVFTPDGKVNDKANLTACYECHKAFDKDDYLTNLAKLAGKFPAAAQVAVKSGSNEVAISGFAFGPAKVTVAAGQPVTWTHADDSPHRSTSPGRTREAA